MFGANGFSLIELMVVITIIALLAAIAMPSFQTYSIRSKVLKATVVTNDIVDSLMIAYQSGKWSCSTTSFTYNGTTYTVNPGATQATSQFPNAISGLQIATSYGTYSCGSNNVIATLQVNTVNTPTNLELVCIIYDNKGAASRKCGIWDGTFPWQVLPQYLPQGFDCLLSSGLTVRGTSC